LTLIEVLGAIALLVILSAAAAPLVRQAALSAQTPPAAIDLSILSDIADQVISHPELFGIDDLFAPTAFEIAADGIEEPVTVQFFKEEKDDHGWHIVRCQNRIVLYWTRHERGDDDAGI
jgi:hypothetical protein